MIKHKYLVYTIFLIFLFTSCEKKDGFDINDTLSIELPFEWRTVVIDDKTDIKNIVTLINTMEIKVDNSEQVNNNMGSFLTTSSKEFFAIIDEEVIKIGELEYNGREQCSAIRNILNKNVYNNNLIIDALKLSESIIISANDMDISKELTEKDKQEIIKNTRFSWNQTPGNLNPEYPDYKLELKFNDGSTKQIFIVDDNNIIFSDDSFGWEKFTTNEELWLNITNIIKPNQLNKENEVSYFFNATELLIEKGIYKGDYINKKNEIVRCLSEAKKVDKNDEKDEVKIELTFNIDNGIYVVYIYETEFKYNDVYYEKPDIYNEIIALITAG